MEMDVNDPTELKKTIHSLKGIAKNLYLEPLGQECEQFEQHLPILTHEERIERINQIRNKCTIVITRMEKELLL
jgi:HPt (histidine-containing phosphotransfer) domain-containing protein